MWLGLSALRFLSPPTGSATACAAKVFQTFPPPLEAPSPPNARKEIVALLLIFARYRDFCAYCKFYCKIHTLGSTIAADLHFVWIHTNYNQCCHQSINQNQNMCNFPLQNLITIVVISKFHLQFPSKCHSSPFWAIISKFHL